MLLHWKFREGGVVGGVGELGCRLSVHLGSKLANNFFGD